MKKILVLILLILSTPMYAQLNVDSIWNILQNESKPDSMRLFNLVRYYKNDLMYNNVDSALTLANVHLEFAKKNNFKKDIARAINNIGVIYYFKSDYDKALEYYNKAIILYKENNEPEKIAGTYTNIGVIYKSRGNYLKALESYKLALANSKAEDYLLIGSKNTNIGNLYSIQNDFIRAIDHLEIGLKNHKLANNQRGVANTLSVIGTVYLKKGEYDKAINYFEHIPLMWRFDGSQAKDMLFQCFKKGAVRSTALLNRQTNESIVNIREYMATESERYRISDNQIEIPMSVSLSVGIKKLR